MKRPEIIYCNVIRKDNESDRAAIKGEDIDNLIGILIDIASDPILWKYLGSVRRVKILDNLKNIGVKVE